MKLVTGNVVIWGEGGGWVRWVSDGKLCKAGLQQFESTLIHLSHVLYLLFLGVHAASYMWREFWKVKRCWHQRGRAGNFLGHQQCHSANIKSGHQPKSRSNTYSVKGSSSQLYNILSVKGSVEVILG